MSVWAWVIDPLAVILIAGILGVALAPDIIGWLRDARRRLRRRDQ